MRSWGSILLGALGLALFDAVVSRPSATTNVGGVFVGASKVVNWFVSAQVPAFANASSSSTSLASLETSSTSTTTGPPALAPIPSIAVGGSVTAGGAPVLAV